MEIVDNFLSKNTFKKIKDMVMNELPYYYKKDNAYVGANDLLDFQSKAEFVEITESGRIEAKPHLL